MNEISEIRRNGVLMSGEDCAVLNAAIRAVVYRVSFGYGWDIVGIENGTLGSHPGQSLYGRWDRPISTDG